MLQVGTDFDLKELIFRNYGQIIGPYSDLVLRHEWGPGQEFTVSVAWIDPANVIAASYEVTIPDSGKVGNHKPQLTSPLRPGVWMVKLMYKWEVTIEMKFLVVPLSFINHTPISQNDAFYSHKGPEAFYSSRDFSELSDYLQVNSTVMHIEAAHERSKYTGHLLDNWIDDLVGLFWSTEGVCAVDNSICDLGECRSNLWSSRSPDPKSEIHGVDQETGFLN